MPDAQLYRSQMREPRRHPARKTLREGYLRFDSDLGSGASAAVVVPRTKADSPVPMYEKSEVYDSRRTREALLLMRETQSDSRETHVDEEPVATLRRKPRQLISRKDTETGGPQAGGATAPVVFVSHASNSESLDGSSLPRGERLQVGDVRQWSGTVVRLFDTTSAGSTRHRAKMRVVIFFDGENVVRYSLFCDNETARGFEEPSSYKLSFRQAQVLAPRADRPAEVYLRYDGQATVEAKGTLVFDGMIIVRGDGKVLCTAPNVLSGNGKAAVLRSAATVGWW